MVSSEALETFYSGFVVTCDKGHYHTYAKCRTPSSRPANGKRNHRRHHRLGLEYRRARTWRGGARGRISVRLAYSMSPNPPSIWMWSTRVYALLCVAVMIAVWAFHVAYPQYQGIPRWLFIFVPFPAFGIEILPVIFVIDVVLAVKGVYRRRTFVVQAIILVIAFCFCLQGLRQSPPPPPESGITVRGACRTVLPHLARLDGKGGNPPVQFFLG